jgi:hypothetical protein
MAGRLMALSSDIGRFGGPYGTTSRLTAMLQQAVYIIENDEANGAISKSVLTLADG